MALDLSIPSGATLVLWVEDPLTRDYLRAIWANPTGIAFRLGGGNEGVRAIVKAFEEEGHRNVFGVMDRDFRTSNKSEWTDPAKTFRTFTLPVHEVENYLLEAPAFHTSRYQNRRVDVASIEARMIQKASQLCWWAVCRDAIAELKRRFREPFVPDPKQSVTDETMAHAHICGSAWFAKLAMEAGRSSEADVHTLLSVSHARASDRLADGTWRSDFPGKEILRDVAGWICDRTKIRRFPSSDGEFYSDLAKSIAAWQLDNGAVPTDLTALLTALHMRIARL
jgi:hypothetical protein